MGGAERAAEVARVLRVDGDRAAADAAEPADDAVTGAGARAQLRRQHLRADRLERAFVAEQLDPLVRGEPLVGSDLCYGTHADPSRQSTTLWPPKPNEFDSAFGVPFFGVSDRDDPGT